jgi:hypothetical protein
VKLKRRKKSSALWILVDSGGPPVDMLDVLFRPSNVYKYPVARQYDVPVIPGRCR